jgi:hypothetical protein
MERFFKSIFRSIVLIGSVAFLLVSCAGTPTQPTKIVPQEPAPKFRLSASGLTATGMWKSTPVLADINGDGHLDLIATVRLGDGAHVWLGDGKGNWTDSSQGLRMANGSCGGGVAVGDFNRDGRPDLAVADHCSGVYVYLQQPDGSWKLVSEHLYPGFVDTVLAKEDDATKNIFVGAEALAVGDIDGDGLLEIVSSASDQGGFAVYHGDRTGKNWKSVKGTGLPDLENPEPNDEDNAGWANQLMLADINGDGKLDVVAAYYKGPRVWLGDGKGHFKSSSQGLPAPVIGGLYRGLTVGDINEDGLMDFMAANDVNGPELYLQQSDGSWSFTGDLMPSLMNGAIGVALGDFNQDGHLDLVVSGRKVKQLGNNNGLYLLLGDGKGNFKEMEATNLPPQGLSVAWGVAVGDVNEDGLLDLAATTGGAVAGDPSKGRPMPKAAPKKPPQKPDQKQAKSLAPESIPELSVPRMQVWVNEGVK